MRRRPWTASSGGAVLCLHGLTTPAMPSNALTHIPVDQLEGLVRATRRVASIVPLAELLSEHRRGAATGGAVAITFDDAYASVGEAAAFFRAESLPVTIFVTTHAADAGKPYWWDRVDDLHPRVGSARWREFEDALGVPEAFRQGQPAELGPLRPLRQWILAEHRGRWPDPLERPLAELEREAGCTTVQRSMSFDELVRLAAIPSVDFGVHTATHPVLPLLSDAEFEGEVAGAHEVLRRRLPRVLPVLAVPFGLFDSRTARLARDCGMTDSLSLAGRTMRGAPGGDAVPRFCLTNRERSWKLALRVTGIAERLRRGDSDRPGEYPALPSATT